MSSSTWLFGDLGAVEVRYLSEVRESVVDSRWLRNAGNPSTAFMDAELKVFEHTVAANHMNINRAAQERQHILYGSGSRLPGSAVQFGQRPFQSPASPPRSPALVSEEEIAGMQTRFDDDDDEEDDDDDDAFPDPPAFATPGRRL